MTCFDSFHTNLYLDAEEKLGCSLVVGAARLPLEGCRDKKSIYE